MADYTPMTNLRGPAARITSVSAETVPADQPSEVIMTGPDQNRSFHFKNARGLPGVNAVDNDEAVATYLGAPDSQTYQAAAENFTRADELAINVSRYPTVQAALDAAPDGATLYFPPEMSPVAVPAGGFQHKANNQTVDAMGVEFQVSDWGTPAFLALRANGGADGHTYRIGNVKYVGVRGNHTGTLRGSALYCSGCGVWSNGDRNYVEYLRTDGMPTPIFFSSWDGTSANDRTGVGNRIGYLEATRYNFGLLYVKQDGFDWGNAYCHTDLDDSAGANPTHAIYGSGAAGARALTGTIGRWHTVDNLSGSAYQIKYSDNVTFDQLIAERCGGLASFQNVNGIKGNAVIGLQLTPGPAGARMFEMAGVDHCKRVDIALISIDLAVNNDRQSAILFVDEMLSIGSLTVETRHSPAMNATTDEVSLRGVGAMSIDRLTVTARGTGNRPVRLGDGTNAGRAAGWTIPFIRSLGNGATLDAIPVEELTHSHSNPWGDGGNFLAGSIPNRGIYRRGMRWANSAPASTQPKGWVQTVNGGLSSAAWAASTAVAAGAWLRLTNGRVLRYVSGGTSGTNEPNPVAIGESGSDGTATWEYMADASATILSEGNL